MDYAIKYPTGAPTPILKNEAPYAKHLERVVKALDELFNEPNRVAKKLDELFPPTLPVTKDVGFVLIVFQGSNMTFASNGLKREEIIKMMREQVRQFEEQANDRARAETIDTNLFNGSANIEGPA